MTTQSASDELTTLQENDLICEKLLGWTREECFSQYIDPDEDCDKQRCECVCHPEYEDDYDLTECNCGYGCPPGNGCRHD